MNTRWIKWAVKKYLPDILTGAACSGVMLTGYFSARAGVRSYRQIENERQHWNKNLTKTEQVKITWKHWVPPFATAVFTCGCIVGCHKVHLHNEAILSTIAAAYATKYANFDRRAKELLNEDEYKQLRQQTVIDEAGDKLDEVPWLKEGEHWYYEPISEQFFVATDQAILYAQLYINKIFQEYGGVTVNDFLNVLPGCSRVPDGREFGWYQGTDGWEEYWGWFGMSHFIDFDFDEIPDRPNVRVIHYQVQPSVPDEEWEPWK